MSNCGKSYFLLVTIHQRVRSMGKITIKLTDEIESKLNDDDDDKLIYCKELAKNTKIEFESAVFKIDYNEIIKKGCDSMEKVHQCLIATKSYMDENDVEVNDSRNNYRKDDGFIPYVDAIKSAIGK